MGCGAVATLSRLCGMMRLDPFRDFMAACQLANQPGLQIVEARFDGTHFGYWHVNVRRKGNVYTIRWEAREGWLGVDQVTGDGSRAELTLLREPHAQMVEHAFDLILATS